MTLTMKVSLSDWEKNLVDEVMKEFGDVVKELDATQVSRDFAKPRTFCKWAWANHVGEALRDVVTDINESYSNDTQTSIHPTRVWGILLDRLSARGKMSGGGRRSISRREQLLRDNPDLEHFIKNYQSQDADEDMEYCQSWVEHNEADEQYWELIDKIHYFVTEAGMAKLSVPEMMNEAQIGNPEGRSGCAAPQEHPGKGKDRDEQIPSHDQFPDTDDPAAATFSEEEKMKSEEEDGQWIFQEFEVYSLTQSVASRARQIHRQTLQDAQNAEIEQALIVVSNGL